MRIGVHLPLMDFGAGCLSLEELLLYTQTAADLGFTTLAANDHLLYSTPWLDGPTVLAAVLSRSRDMTLATTVSLPAVRGPVPLAKALTTLDLLSGGRMRVGLGPGSSRLDYDAVGLDFDQRWGRLEESVAMLRALWSVDTEPFTGNHYDSGGIAPRPLPKWPGGPPVWIGSWGSPAGLRRVAKLADGWLASAYNTTPQNFARNLDVLGHELDRRGRSTSNFPNALATLWFYITDNHAEADRIIHERLGPATHLPEPILRERVAVGPAEDFAAKLAEYQAAGALEVLIWPVTDEVRQLVRFCQEVRPSLR